MYERTYHRVLPKEETEGIQKKRKLPWKSIGVALLFFLFLFGFIYVSRLPKLQIGFIKVEGTEVLDQEAIRQFVVDYISGYTLWVFPKKSTLIVQTESLQKDIARAFSRVKNVSVKRENLNTLVVSIKEHEGAFLWCTQQGKCFFMNQEGLVYADAPEFSGTAYPKLFFNTSVQELPFQGAQSETIELVSKIHSRLKTINIIPSEFHFVDQRKVDVLFLHNKDTATLVIDPTVPSETSLDYFFSGIRTEPLTSLFKDTTKKLLYIDVRFPNNIVYKFE